MATKIKLMRLGKMREPHYRIVVADARTRRDGRAIETIGEYHPKHDPSIIRVDGERAAYWLGVGAQPTEAVTAILKVTGDWQKFTGQPAPEPMKVAPAKPDKRALFDAALADADGQASAEATTPRKRAPAKAPAKAAREAPADAPTETAPPTDTAPRTDTAPPTEITPTETPPSEPTPTESAATDPAPVEAPAAAADTPEGAEPTES